VTDVDALVERYMAVWHEPDAEERRKAITGLWAPDGSYVDPTQEASGHDALFTVASAIYEEFVRPGKFVFRTGSNIQSHHNILRFRWELAEVETGQVIDSGLDILVTDNEGRIAADYKFIGPPDTRSELNQFADRYVRLWQTPDEDERRQLITELWAPDGTQIYPTGDPRGHEAMFARVTRSFDLFIASGEYQFVSDGDADGHHNLLRFNWAMIRVEDGEVADVGFELFVRDTDRRILADYQFVGKLHSPPPTSQE
jgi:hypothetical protein